ncbi:MAG: hypothetical protein JXA11_13220 [Phycisphaerae bacterium]|nr:hypothetical protein [Phycisphaerae bacterium]
MGRNSPLPWKRPDYRRGGTQTTFARRAGVTTASHRRRSAPAGRPKVLVGYNPAAGEVIFDEDDLPDGFEHWIVKFIVENDEQVATPCPTH